MARRHAWWSLGCSEDQSCFSNARPSPGNFRTLTIRVSRHICASSDTRSLPFWRASERRSVNSCYSLSVSFASGKACIFCAIFVIIWMQNYNLAKQNSLDDLIDFLQTVSYALIVSLVASSFVLEWRCIMLSRVSSVCHIVFKSWILISLCI